MGRTCWYEQHKRGAGYGCNGCNPCTQPQRHRADQPSNVWTNLRTKNDLKHMFDSSIAYSRGHK